jgi:FAD dependent oxidoreductase
VTIHTKQAPYRTYSLAATLTRGSLPDALYWDTVVPYHYVRLQPHSEHQDIVIIGGEDHKSGQANDGEARFAALESWAREHLPKMGKVIHRWSGQVMEPADYVGFIGRNSGDKHRYIATGDSGQGITNGVIASMLIANLILDGNSPWVKAYDPARMITKNIGGYLSENMTVLKNFAEYPRQFVPYSDAARWPISAQNTAEDPGSTRPAFPQRRSSNANSLCGQNSAGFPQIRATFQRHILRRHF